MVEIITSSGTEDGKKTSEETFISEIKHAYHLYFAGMFKVSGNGIIIKLWPEIAYYISTLGRIAVVEKDKSVVLAKVVEKKIEKDLTGEIVKITVEYFDEKKTQETNPLKYVVFWNNLEGTANLIRHNHLLKTVYNLWNSFNADLKRSKPRMLINSPLDPNKDRLKEIRASFEEDVIVLASLGDGVDIKWDKWEPRSNMREILTSFRDVLSLYEKFNGIRHNTAAKEDRHISGEIDLILDPFHYTESVRKQLITKALKEAEKLGEGNNDYKLTHE